MEAEISDRLTTYVLIDARDRLEVTLTPAAMQVLHDLSLAFTRNSPTHTQVAALRSLEAPLVLSNDIGPGSIVTLTSKTEVSGFGYL